MRTHHTHKNALLEALVCLDKARAMLKEPKADRYLTTVRPAYEHGSAETKRIPPSDFADMQSNITEIKKTWLWKDGRAFWPDSMSQEEKKEATDRFNSLQSEIESHPYNALDKAKAALEDAYSSIRKLI